MPSKKEKEKRKRVSISMLPMKWHNIMILVCISLMTENIEHLFMCLWYSQIFFINWVTWLTDFEEFVYFRHSGCKSNNNLQVFFPVLVHFVTFLIAPFESQRFWLSWSSAHGYFNFITWTQLLPSYLTILRLWRFVALFCSEGLIVLRIAFKSMTNLELMFIYGVR